MNGSSSLRVFLKPNGPPLCFRFQLNLIGSRAVRQRHKRQKLKKLISSLKGESKVL